MAYSQWQRWRSEVLLTRRAVWALAVALGAFALLQLVLQRAALAWLAPYPAVVLVFLVAIVLPGLLLQRALLTGADIDLGVRLPVALALGLGVAAIPGLIALSVHLDLQAFATMHSVLAAIVCGASVLFSREAPGEARGTREPGVDPGGLLVVAIAGVVLAGVVTTPLWAGDEVPANADTWTYMAYVRDYIDTDRLNEEEPFLGTGEAVNPRMLANVWVLTQALVADASDVQPADVLIRYLPPLLAAFALLATYAVARTLFQNSFVGWLAVLFQMGYAFLDLAPHEGFGRNLLFRIGEDKMMADLIIFPVAVLIAARFISKPGLGSYAAFAVVTLGLSVVHPFPLFFLGVALVALAAVRTWVERASKPLPSVGLLLVPVALVSIGPLVQRMLLVDAVPGIFDVEGSSVSFRDEFHFTDVPWGLFIGNYHMIVHPLMLAAIVLAPLMWLRSRRPVGAQLVFAMTMGALLIFFVPPLSNLVSELMTPQALWRMPRMIPVALILAYTCYQGAMTLEAWARTRAPSWRLWLRHSFVSVASAIGALLLLGSALLIQEQYLRFDDGSFYNASSTTSILPGTKGSIFLGGKDYIVSAHWRLSQPEIALFRNMEALFPRGSTVLVDPAWLNHFIPGVLTDIYPIDFGGIAGEGPRRQAATIFSSSQLTASDLEAIVDSYGVAYIVARELEPANRTVRSFSRAELLREVGPYQIYQIQP